MYVRAKKWLGQHFLRDENVCRKIAGLVPTENIPPVLLEIGPGTGALTRFLPKEAYQRILLLDVDRESIAFLNKNYNYAPFEIMEADFLAQDLATLAGGPLVVCGNFPYNISSQIFFKVLDFKDMVPTLIGMVQKEVGRRIATGPGSREYGILSVLLQTWYDIKYEFTVAPGAFVPPPKVDSGVLSFHRNSRTELPIEQKYFTRIVKEAFNQRRKTLRNALKGSTPPGFDHPYFEKRAEQLSVEEFIELAVALKG